MRLDPCLITLTEESKSTDASGGSKLDREDSVDLADELVANVDGRLGYRASELWLDVSERLLGKCDRTKKKKENPTRETYLEIVGNVVLAAARRTKEALRFIIGAGSLGVGGRRVSVILIGLLLGSALVLGRRSHSADSSIFAC
jgi:hypothetical protein